MRAVTARKAAAGKRSVLLTRPISRRPIVTTCLSAGSPDRAQGAGWSNHLPATPERATGIRPPLAPLERLFGSLRLTYTGAHAPGSPRCPRRARTQPQEPRGRAAARPLDRHHRPLGQRQEQPRLRHHLRRGPAPLRGEPLGLRAAVPGPDGEARRRPDRRPEPGHLHRPEGREPQPTLDGGHGDRDLRPPAAALPPHRAPALPGLRPGGARGSCPTSTRCSRPTSTSATPSRSSSTGSSCATPTTTDDRSDPRTRTPTADAWPTPWRPPPGSARAAWSRGGAGPRR